MLPPDTTATTLRWPRAAIAGESAAATAQAGGAFGDDVRALGDAAASPRATSSSETTIELVHVVAQERPHRLEHRLAAGAVDERRLSSSSKRLARPARSERASGAAVSGSAA